MTDETSITAHIFMLSGGFTTTDMALVNRLSHVYSVSRQAGKQWKCLLWGEKKRGEKNW